MSIITDSKNSSNPLPNSNSLNESKKLTPPTEKKIANVFKEMSEGQLEINKKVFDAGVVAPREILGYDLIHRETSLLNQWRKCKNENEFKAHMLSLGYEPREITMIHGSSKISTTLYYKDNYKIIYAMNSNLVIYKVLPNITDTNRFEDESWLFNYQDKLCVSCVSPQGNFYYSNGKIGMVLKVKSEDLVEIFPRDKLSPVGFRLHTLNNVSAYYKQDPSFDKKVEEEKKSISEVENYLQFQKNYQALVKYCDTIFRECLNPALHSDNLDIQKRAYEMLLSLDEDGKTVSRKPLGGKFHQVSALTTRLLSLYAFIQENKELLESPEAYKQIFGKDKEGSIIKEIEALIQYSTVLDNNFAKYNSHVLSSKAKEWGVAWGHKDVAATTAYLAGKIHGRHAITHPEKEADDPYNEINVNIPKIKGTHKQQPDEIEIAGFMVDRALFEENSQGLFIDIQKAQDELNSLLPEHKKLKKRLEEAEQKKDTTEIAEAKKAFRPIDTRVFALNNKVNFFKLATECQSKNIPILCTS